MHNQYEMMVLKLSYLTVIVEHKIRDKFCLCYDGGALILSLLAQHGANQRL